jgi:two-component system chemotaxis response regulator CheB
MLEVVGEARDGQQALELCRDLRPDVVTMDMVLPSMSGLSATEYIMAYFPTPILVVSASSNRGERIRTYDALAAGAVDALEKPLGNEGPGAWERALVDSVKVVSRIRVITRRKPSESNGAAKPSDLESRPSGRLIAAIGASTGGPRAVVQLLRALPHPYPLPVVIAVHLPPGFGESFAEWLDGESPHRVVLASDGGRVGDSTGRVTLAPPDRHLTVEGARFRLTSAPERNGCRPSIDTLFESLATEYASACVACLLTGMGSDGARGLLAIRERGGLTIAQDESTSTIYGMPRAAALLGAARRILPLGEIGAVLADLRPRSVGAAR